MTRWLAKIVLRIFGWRTDGTLPPGIHKAVVIAAPHTSYMDFVIGFLTFHVCGMNTKFMIKAEAFRPPFGFFMKMLGGLPVDRGNKNNNMVDQMARMFREAESLIVIITPEGTRRKVEQWKKGFYMIAMEAGVPIVLSFIDYGTKTGGIGPVLIPSGDYATDIIKIQDFYKNKTGRFPDQFSLPTGK
jgi:1-acyl-sn-glycerol-3-phosphate acyltransferase